MISSSKIDRVTAVLLLLFFASHLTYAAQVVKQDDTLTRRPLHDTRNHALQFIRTKRFSENIIGTMHYCQGARLFIAKNQNAHVFTLYVNDTTYHTLIPPHGVRYTIYKIGDQYISGVIIDTNRINLPDHGSFTFVYPYNHTSNRYPTETILLIREHSNQDNRSHDYLCNKQIHGDGLDFSEGASVFLENESALTTHPGMLIPLREAHEYSQGIYLNRETGFDLSGLNTADIPEGVIVYLDQNMGDIPINETITAPYLERPYSIAFYGIDTNHDASRDHMVTSFTLEETPTSLIQQGNDTLPIIDCQHHLKCAVYNLDFRASDGRTLKKLVHGPSQNFVYHVYTTQNNDTETVVLHNGDLERNRITVYTSNNHFTSLRQNACKMCNDLEACDYDISCYGPCENCPDGVIFQRDKVNCSTPFPTVSTTTTDDVVCEVPTVASSFGTSAATTAATTAAAGIVTKLTPTGLVVGAGAAACCAIVGMGIAVDYARYKYGSKKTLTHILKEYCHRTKEPTTLQPIESFNTDPDNDVHQANYTPNHTLETDSL